MEAPFAVSRASGRSARTSGGRALAAITIGVWLIVFAALTMRSLGDSALEGQQFELGWRRALLCVAGVGVTYLFYRLMALTRERPLAHRLAIAFTMSLAGGLLYAFVVHALFFYTMPPPTASPTASASGLPPWRPDEAAPWMKIFLTAIPQAWVFLSCLAADLGLDYDARARDRDLQLARAEALSIADQNKLLRQQINPHFLFNTLNALSTLILQGRNATAEQVVLSLANFMRRSLQLDSKPIQTLGEEIQATMEYLSIERVRFGDRLRIVCDTSDDISDAELPTLILQPLVENAVKHGVADASGPVTITISAFAEGRRLRLCVRDDGDGGRIAKTGLGVGLNNVRSRLQNLYGADADVRCEQLRPRGFAVELALPLTRHAAAA
jgi:two-component sensor histidine kinase